MNKIEKTCGLLDWHGPEIPVWQQGRDFAS
jgi:hypothetical protein